jgi:hypothetical protein
VAKERANPVSSHSIAEHGVHVLACGYDVVLVLVHNGREVNVRNWSGVAMAGERYDFRRFLGHGSVCTLKGSICIVILAVVLDQRDWLTPCATISSGVGGVDRKKGPTKAYLNVREYAKRKGNRMGMRFVTS